MKIVILASYNIMVVGGVYMEDLHVVSRLIQDLVKLSLRFGVWG